MIEGYRVFDSATGIKAVLVREGSVPPEGDFSAAQMIRVADAVFDGLSADGPGQGVFGICEIPRPGTVARNGRYVFLDALQDPGNVGTIVRIAAAFALDGVIAGAGTADPFAPKAARSAAGAVFKVPIVQGLGAEGLEGFHLVAADMSGIPLPDFARPGAFVLAVGNEGSGLSKEILEAASARVSVPMAGQTESLNAAVAAGIILYEFVRGGN